MHVVFFTRSAQVHYGIYNEEVTQGGAVFIDGKVLGRRLNKGIGNLVISEASDRGIWAL